MVQILPKGILNAEIILVSVHLLKGLSDSTEHSASRCSRYLQTARGPQQQWLFFSIQLKRNTAPSYLDILFVLMSGDFLPIHSWICDITDAIFLFFLFSILTLFSYQGT